MSVANNGTECSEGSREHPLWAALCPRDFSPTGSTTRLRFALNDKYYKTHNSRLITYNSIKTPCHPCLK